MLLGWVAPQGSFVRACWIVEWCAFCDADGLVFCKALGVVIPQPAIPSDKATRKLMARYECFTIPAPYSQVLFTCIRLRYREFMDNRDTRKESPAGQVLRRFSNAKPISLMAAPLRMVGNTWRRAI